MTASNTQTLPSSHAPLFWPLCCGAGVLWACPALLLGAGPLAFLSIAAGATLSQACLVWSARVYGDGPRLLAVTFAAMGIVAPLGAFALEFLRANTHHRPLGAVTFSFLLLATAAAVWLVLWLVARRVIGVRLGGLVLLVGLGATALFGADANGAASLLFELALGVVLAVAHVRLAPRVPVKGPQAITWSVLGLLLLGAVVSRAPEIQREAKETAPVALGLLGLIH